MDRATGRVKDNVPQALHAPQRCFGEMIILWPKAGPPWIGYMPLYASHESQRAELAPVSCTRSVVRWVPAIGTRGLREAAPTDWPDPLTAVNAVMKCGHRFWGHKADTCYQFRRCGASSVLSLLIHLFSLDRAVNDCRNRSNSVLWRVSQQAAPVPPYYCPTITTTPPPPPPPFTTHIPKL